MSTGSRTPDYDFFAPGPVPGPPDQGPPSTSTGPPASGFPGRPGHGAPPVNQFGTPLGAYPQQLSAPAPGRSASAGVSVPGWVWRVGISLAVTVVLGVLGVGRFAALFEGELEVPQTLDGLSQTTDPALLTLASVARGTLTSIDELDDEDSAAAVYSDGASRVVVLMAARAPFDADGAVGVASTFGQSTLVGSDTMCAQAHDASATLCMRGDDDLTAAVVVPGAADTADAARLLDRAWDDL